MTGMHDKVHWILGASLKMKHEDIHAFAGGQDLLITDKAEKNMIVENKEV